VLLGAGGAAAAVAIVLGALALRIPWERTPVYFAYEQIASLTDPHGHRSYTGESTFNKGDNNRFRWVWWQSAVGETIDGGPWLGLGFGYDLADQFVREFYPEDTDEFTTRSPHNVLVTVFARMGAVGLAAFLAVAAVTAARTWRAIARGPEDAAPWCAAWAVLTSACFGVVLEGPMGAVVFWTLLGLGQAGHAPPAEETPAAVGSAGSAGEPDRTTSAGQIAANS
jgi:O-antigen ligase